ncbi:MAG: hypothetical protein Q8P17_00470 [bacterium]|nr:hypothetical protein [bacterium]
MSEGPQNSEKYMKKSEYIRLAVELSEHTEAFPFFGISSDAYIAIKEGEQEDPGYATPIDVLIERFREHGVKIVLGKNPQSGNVFVLPFGSNNIEEDSIFPWHLDIRTDMDPKLKKLILANRDGLVI